MFLEEAISLVQKALRLDKLYEREDSCNSPGLVGLSGVWVSTGWTRATKAISMVNKYRTIRDI